MYKYEHCGGICCHHLSFWWFPLCQAEICKPRMQTYVMRRSAVWYPSTKVEDRDLENMNHRWGHRIFPYSQYTFRSCFLDIVTIIYWEHLLQLPVPGLSRQWFLNLWVKIFQESPSSQELFKTLWRIKLLLGKDLDTNNDTTTVSMQSLGRLTSTKIDTIGNGVFYVVRAEELSWRQLGRHSLWRQKTCMCAVAAVIFGMYNSVKLL
jgi:hypothetical protein